MMKIQKLSNIKFGKISVFLYALQRLSLPLHHFGANLKGKQFQDFSLDKIKMVLEITQFRLKILSKHRIFLQNAISGWCFV